MSPPEPLVVEVERSGLIESVHIVDAAVAGADGALRAWAGDAERLAYLRSSAKPVQATACLEAGWVPPGSEQLAVACASHNGEPAHSDAVRRTLAAAGLDEEALRCPAAWPARPEDVARVAGPMRIFHDCSGKHAAMLATCAANGWSLDYPVRDHPMQRAVEERLGSLAGRPPRATGVDGCGVPTFAFTLAEAARVFANLAIVASRALDAMAAHPFLVAGTGRLCTEIAGSLPGVVVKIGAEGLACGVLRADGIGFAVKARDGTARARDAATVHVLAALGALGSRTPEDLLAVSVPAVTGGPEVVGAIRARGALAGA